MPHDVTFRGDDSLPDAYLTRPFRHGDDPDVHDPDPADKQRDRGDPREKENDFFVRGR